MAQHYEPDKIIQLVQLCSWRERTEMSQNGQIDLANKLAPEQQFNDRYIVDLMTDARKAVNEGSTIKKIESNINVLLNHAGFNNWDAWKTALRIPGNFLSPETEHFDNPEKQPFTIVVPQQLEKQLVPTLTVVQKTTPIELYAANEASLVELAKHAIGLLENKALIICAIPLSWKDQAVKMRQPAWGDFSGTKRILPVWVDTDDVWNPATPFLPSVKQPQSTAGLPGILTGLLFLENYLKQDASELQNQTNQPARSGGPQFNHSPVGFYMEGGEIHNLVTGGNQTINNHFN
ncbi:hypothetical protein [Fluviicola sp.]|uniref:hypothetical protein n=1 Tax=Fluviicola sp. TaxID=1917219 RepID=UPI0031E3A2B7